MSQSNKNCTNLVLKLALKYHYNKRHALFVETTSTKLFDALSAYHGFGNEEKLILRHAGILHDIGSFISEKKHHQHSKYLIESDELLESYPEYQRYILSLVVFNHKKKVHKDTLKLEKADMDLVLKLSSILRIADSIDCADKKIEIKSISIDNSKLNIAIKGSTPQSLSSRLNKKKKLFLDVFNLDIFLYNEE